MGWGRHTESRDEFTILAANHTGRDHLVTLKAFRNNIIDFWFRRCDLEWNGRG